MTELEFAIKIAKQAGERAAEFHKTLADSEVHAKGDKSVVTDIDIELNAFLKDEILKAYPEHGVISEEDDTENGSAEHVWTIDPIDGTRLFVFELPLYSIAIAKLENGEPVLSVVYFPETDQLLVAEKGGETTLNGKPLVMKEADPIERTILLIGTVTLRKKMESLIPLLKNLRTTRQFGCITVDALLLTTGKVSGSMYGSVSDWDAYPTIMLVKAAGGVALNGDGEDWKSGDDFLILGPKKWCRMILKELF